MTKYDEFLKINYTDDDDFNVDAYHFTDGLLDVIDKLQNDVQKKKKGIVDTLLRYIKKHPKNPVLRDLLVHYFQLTEQYERATAATVKLHTLFPNYLMGKIYRAQEYMLNGESQKVLEIFGNPLSLQNQGNQDNTVHLDEALSFLQLAIKFYAAQGMLDKAQEYVNHVYRLASQNDVEIIRYVEEIMVQYKKIYE